MKPIRPERHLIEIVRMFRDACRRNGMETHGDFWKVCKWTDEVLREGKVQ
jgi:hypothetical protein